MDDLTSSTKLLTLPLVQLNLIGRLDTIMSRLANLTATKDANDALSSRTNAGFRGPSRSGRTGLFILN